MICYPPLSLVDWSVWTGPRRPTGPAMAEPFSWSRLHTILYNIRLLNTIDRTQLADSVRNTINGRPNNTKVTCQMYTVGGVIYWLVDVVVQEAGEVHPSGCITGVTNGPTTGCTIVCIV